MTGVKVPRINTDVAVSLVKCFDNKDGKKVLDVLEKRIKTGFPNYQNVNIHMALSGKLSMIDEIRTLVNMARDQIEKEKREANKNDK